MTARLPVFVIPAQAGIHHPAARACGTVDPGLRRDDS
jgi:hypothetical protein